MDWVIISKKYLYLLFRATSLVIAQHYYDEDDRRDKLEILYIEKNGGTSKLKSRTDIENVSPGKGNNYS
jgi:hypothetical protein